MKTAFPITAIFLAAMVYAARADGIPYDSKTGKVVVPHRILTLDANQSEEVELLHTLTLTPDQWAAFRKAAPACPKRIDVILKKTYNDCMCGVEGFYGIQLAQNSVAIPLYQFEQSPLAVIAQVLARKSDGTVSLTVDRRGQFYCESLIPYPDLVALLKRAVPAGPAAASREIYVSVCLPVDLTADSPVLASRLEEIRVLCKNAGYELSLH